MEKALEYRDGDRTCRGWVVTPDADGPRPAVLVFPTWKGLEDFAKAQARRLADLGYVGLAADVYGDGAVGEDDEDCARRMGALLEDRPALRRRVAAAFDATASLPEVDEHHVAAIGFCFGGLCVLDLARSGADVVGVASFHGFFHNPEPALAERIRARVLAFHGSDDPLVSWSEVTALRTEMAAANVDWELVVLGGAQHGFMNPAANAPERGVAHHPEAARRAWARLEAFLTDLLT